MAAFTRTSNETVTAADGFEVGESLSSTTTVGVGIPDETTTPGVGGATRWTEPLVGEGVQIFTNDAGSPDETSTPDVGGDTRWTEPLVGEGVVTSRAAGTSDEVTLPTSSVDDGQWTETALPAGLNMPGSEPAGVGSPDEVEQTFGTAQYISESATTDSESHAHFVGRRPYLLFRGQTDNEAWHNPTTTSFTGYARDGTRYTAGVQDGGPVFAPWYSESASADRSSVGAFPSDYLICATRSEIVIFDFANYPTDLDVWMRFRLGDSGTFKLISRIEETITDVKMANGVMILVTKYNGLDNGGLFLIDFRQDDRQFLNLIRNDDHWTGTSGRDITDRDIGGNFDPAGVSPELRLRPINPESVSVYAPSDGDTYWVAVNGEDIGPDVYEVDSSGVPQMRSVPLGKNVGADDLSNSRHAVFDFDGWLWHSVGSIVYRNGIDYQEGSIRMPSKYDPRYRYVDLGVTVTGLISSLNYVYAATDVGVYRIDRGTLQSRLMWTIVGGGGLGLAGTPGSGEVLVGDNPVIERLTEWTLAGAGFIGIATSITAGYSGGVTLIRTSDDTVIDSKVYSDLAEDGSYVIQPVGL